MAEEFRVGLPHPTYPVLPYPTPTYTVIYWPHPILDTTPSYPILPHPTLSYPVLPILPPSYPSYTVFYCHPTTSYLVLHWILLPSYPTLDSSTHSILPSTPSTPSYWIMIIVILPYKENSCGRVRLCRIR